MKDISALTKLCVSAVVLTFFNRSFKDFFNISRPAMDEEVCLLTGAPPSFYYIPDFISEAEEANLMRHVDQSPSPRCFIMNAEAKN